MLAGSNTDGGFAITHGPQITGSFGQLAVTIRANYGQIEAYGANGYPTTGYPYTANTPVDVIVTGNVARRQFSAWAATPGHAYALIANANPFRSTGPAAYLDTLMVWADAGFVSVDVISASCSGAGAAVTVSSGSQWQALTLPQSQQGFAVHLRATFSASADAGIALTQGIVATSNYDQLAATVRAAGGQLSARGPTSYPATGVPFNTNAPVDMIIAGNTAERVYSVWVAQAGQAYVQIANNIGLRSTAQAAYIDKVMVWADAGSVTASLVTGSCTPLRYHEVVLSDSPVAAWRLDSRTATEIDVSGNGNAAVYRGGTPNATTMPNGDAASDFDGTSEYLEANDNPSFSIPYRHVLTWEAWIRPDVLKFPIETGENYVMFLGKCDDSHGSCEWAGRMYGADSADRQNRISGYVFNPAPRPGDMYNYGSGAYWQPLTNVVQAGKWLHVVVEYSTNPTSLCTSSQDPGAISIWVNGTVWDAGDHVPTGCMSQYSVIPQDTASVLRVGTMEKDSFFQGAIGKVALYNYLVSQQQITTHYKAMTGRSPSGSCSNQGCSSSY